MSSSNYFAQPMGNREGQSTSTAALFVRRNSELLQPARRTSPSRTFGDFKPRSASTTGTRVLMSDSEIQQKAEREWYPTRATIREHLGRNPSPPAKKSIFGASLRPGRSPRYFDNVIPAKPQRVGARTPSPPRSRKLYRGRSGWQRSHSSRNYVKSTRFSCSSSRDRDVRADSVAADDPNPSKLKTIHNVISNTTKRTEDEIKKEKARWDERVENVLNLKTTLTRIEGLGRTLRLTAQVFESLYSTVETICEEVDSTITASLSLSKLPLREKRKLLEALLTNKSFTQEQSDTESDSEEPELVADLGHLPSDDNRRSATKRAAESPLRKVRKIAKGPGGQEYISC